MFLTVSSRDSQRYLSWCLMIIGERRLFDIGEIDEHHCFHFQIIFIHWILSGYILTLNTFRLYSYIEYFQVIFLHWILSGYILTLNTFRLYSYIEYRYDNHTVQSRMEIPETLATILGTQYTARTQTTQ
jgi:hypothetical protein